jgi:hypothetical protein
MNALNFQPLADKTAFQAIAVGVKALVRDGQIALPGIAPNRVWIGARVRKRLAELGEAEVLVRGWPRYANTGELASFLVTGWLPEPDAAAWATHGPLLILQGRAGAKPKELTIIPVTPGQRPFTVPLPEQLAPGHWRLAYRLNPTTLAIEQALSSEKLAAPKVLNIPAVLRGSSPPIKTDRKAEAPAPVPTAKPPAKPAPAKPKPPVPVPVANKALERPKRPSEAISQGKRVLDLGR